MIHMDGDARVRAVGDARRLKHPDHRISFQDFMVPVASGIGT